ncbi:broad-specificity cellobiase [Thermosporothrix hazakensis]|jgi:beta-glucosidase|uniref:Beta-glucosidase n=1 Tax=Thermosporothrix hazakensis TaxID=644383 RepID=A0A326UCX2_THEHA|nr:GH1 family beta-glucosidase [Thermosporothrix hazakensis]PZW34345.1 broad-specificity cellobiase [Thermosporothrix hazakensis]GCE46106.1 beta-glucosidase [Thermosporothrix hazakensis]
MSQKTATEGAVHSDRFPSHFLWGASTSAYQIEGATRVDGRGESIWDRFAATPGKVYQGDTGDVALEHYYRFQEDIALMKKLHFNAYCFSIAWPRIIPEGTGTVNEKGLDFYDRLVDELLAQGITPLVKLYHWDLPYALQERGGWLRRETAQAFADYAEIVARRLRDRVNWWITFNEPWCIAYLGHGVGVHAPGLANKQDALNAGHHVLLAHGLVLPRLRALLQPGAKIGFTVDPYPVYAMDESDEARQQAERLDRFRNRWFLDPLFRGCYPDGLFEDLGCVAPDIQPDDMARIAAPLDFLGVNYYSRWRTSRESNALEALPVPEDAPRTVMGWEIYPQGLLEALRQVQQDYAPPAIVITENGAAFNDIWDGGDLVHDPERVEYMRSHLASIEAAVAEGIPVQGHFAWSLMDNYEWAEGYSKRFGLVYVDYPSQKRIIKQSGLWYANYIEAQQKSAAVTEQTD